MAMNFVVTSPRGNTAVTVTLSNCGKLTYTAAQDGIKVVETSDMGLVTSIGDFTTGLTYVAEEDSFVNETYPMISGKRKIYTNKCNVKTVKFAKDGITFVLVLRAYNDGIAFRYLIETADKTEMTVEPNAEITSFKLPDGADIWFMHRGGKSFMYEDNYFPGKIGETEPGIRPSLPMLYRTGGKYGLIIEADRHGNYTGSLLTLQDGGIMRMIFDLAQERPVVTSAPFTSPWRTIIIGSPVDIMQNTMVENLSPAPDAKYAFEKWVDPGLSSWSWVSYYGGQEDPNIHKKFIDLAADMGWKYYILDEKWQPGSKTPGTRYEGMWDWFKDVKAHADEKGIKLFAWVDKTDVATRERRIARFKEWSEVGIVGIKVDFFFNDSQDMMQLYDDIYKDAADYKLMVNAHGSNPPSGELRTWPNALAREAIRGQEQGGIMTEQYTLIPFLRSAVGTADVTEQLYSRDTGKTTMGFQIALSTLIENGIHSMGSKPEEYYSVPAAIDLYADFPSSWDDLYVINAEVGVQVNLARRCGDAWYVGGISVQPRTFSYKPTFLAPDKTYTAVVYHEKEGERQAIDMYAMNNVTKDTPISVDVQRGGGYSIKFIPQGSSDLKAIKADTTELEVETYYNGEIKIAFEPDDAKAKGVVWTLSDSTVAKIAPNMKGAVLKGMKAGKTTLTISSVYDENITTTVDVTVKPAKYLLDEQTWKVINSNLGYVVSGENEVSITAEQGIISKNVFAMKAEGNLEISAKISGELNANWQGGFIGFFTEDLREFVSIGRRYHTNYRWDSETPYSHVAMMSAHSEKYVPNPNGNGDVYVRLTKKGDKYEGWYKASADAEWTLFEDGITDVPELAGELYAGFYTGCGGSTNSVTLTVSSFSVNSKEVKIANVNTEA